MLYIVLAIVALTFLRRFFSTPVSAEAMSAARTKAQGIIDDNAVAVFSKSYCPYCKATKSLLSEQGAKFYTIELDQVGEFALLNFYLRLDCEYEWGRLSDSARGVNRTADLSYCRRRCCDPGRA